ncbi:MAG: tRNA 4-thiouridine(8) synthase ThiI [Zetaproteobacteria bacterium]|nr:tRNA 4-thiouridine(8) synthase ThiI [Zetaproteobacteria bacterium]
MIKIIIHYGELSLKGKNRGRFERQLATNLKYIFKPLRIHRNYGRMLLDMESITPEQMDLLALMPGIRNFAVAYEAELTLESLQQTALAAMRATYPDQDLTGQSFCVASKRANKRFPIQSPEMNLQVGGYLKEYLQLTVNLSKPAIKVFVEVADEGAYIFINKRDGIGGLPVGSSGKGVVLFSGGIDSPVAAYTMMKRGMEVILVHLYNSSINRDFQKIRNLAAQLSRYQGRTKLIMIDLEEFQRHAIANVPDKYRMIIYKRQMIREAAAVALAEKGQALVTGDSLGQVASQTLANIQAIYDASPLPILSPLIGYDKEEIIALAQRIGTFPISIEEYCDICSFLIAKHPETKARSEIVARLEKELPLYGLENTTQTVMFYAGEVSKRTIE